MCHYCKKNEAINDNYFAAVDIWKYEETGVIGAVLGALSGRKYFMKTVPIPRCKSCRDEHNDYGMFSFSLKKTANRKGEEYVRSISELRSWNIGSGPN